MLSIYDLYDLHAIFVRIRFSPENAINYDIIQKVTDVLKNNRENSDANQFRIAVRSVSGLEKNKLYDFIYTENKYIYYPLSPLSDESICAVLISCCEELLRVISEKNTEHISAIADCLHNLPIFIAENNLTIPKNFWKYEVTLYRKKWNKNFLLAEQKLNKKWG